MRIVFGEPNSGILHPIVNAPEAERHSFLIAKTGPDALELCIAQPPDLLVIDIMMPIMHGIEVLSKIKAEHADIPVIITSFHTMMQNYRAALDAGANYFLTKPFSAETFFSLVELAEKKQLSPSPRPPDSHPPIEQQSCYLPKPSILRSYIKFWGTRGSNPVSGNNYIRYGGNTCSLEVRHKESLAVIDAGTGIRPLGELLERENLEHHHLIIGHTHWDHITGFPFFAPVYQKGGSITIWSPVGFEKSTQTLFTDMLAYAYFPVRLDEMHSKIAFKELHTQQPIRIGELEINAYFTNHPGPTLGFTISGPSKKIGYITDNEMLMGYLGHPNDITRDHPLLQPHLGLIEFLSDCDVIVHEAQYFPEEYINKIGWGHSSIANAAVLIRETGCKEWIVTHHDPVHTDKDLQIKTQLHKDVLKECGIDCHVYLAYDGLVVPLD